MKRYPLLLAALLLPFTTGCVSSSKYDAAIKSAEDARADVQRTARLASEDAASRKASETKAAALQKSLDETTAENAQLRGELEHLGKDADTLLTERGVLASALGESRARLDELRRAETAARMRSQLFHDLAIRLKRMVDAGDMSVSLRDGRMVLQLPNDVLFESGQVDIKPRGQAALKAIAGALKTIEGRHFQVAGHTDNVPIETARFPSNWELSTARALEVVRFIVRQGVPAPAVSAAGYGEFDPVASNDDPKGRTRNRRIEITLQPNVDEIVAVPDAR